MSFRISAPKDFWAGFIYVAFGIFMLWYGADYRMGTAGRMGPGYFPKVLAGLLIGFGMISLVRGFIAKGEAIGKIEWKPLFFILLGCALFGLVLQPIGLIVALLALCLVSAAASKEFAFDLKATAGLVLLIVFCAIVFVKGLGVPMPIVGKWLEPITTVYLPWLR